MLDFPGKQFKRDHRYQIPVCPDCHRGPQGIHGLGSEVKWWESIGFTRDRAVAKVIDLWAESIGL